MCRRGTPRGRRRRRSSPSEVVVRRGHATPPYGGRASAERPPSAGRQGVATDGYHFPVAGRLPPWSPGALLGGTLADVTTPSPPSNALPDPADSEDLRCSARGCRRPAQYALRWNNPKLHTADRRKTWLACDDHRASLSTFLDARGFLREVVRLGASCRIRPSIPAPPLAS